MLQITPIDSNKADGGAVTSYRGVKLKIARSGNDEFAKKFTRLTKPIKNSLEDDSVDPKTLEKVLCDSLAGTILVGWTNLVVENKEVKYSVDLAAELLVNDPDCRKFVQKFSDDINNFLKLEEEETKGK